VRPARRRVVNTPSAVHNDRVVVVAAVVRRVPWFYFTSASKRDGGEGVRGLGSVCSSCARGYWLGAGRAEGREEWVSEGT